MCTHISRMPKKLASEPLLLWRKCCELHLKFSFIFPRCVILIVQEYIGLISLLAAPFLDLPLDPFHPFDASIRLLLLLILLLLLLHLPEDVSILVDLDLLPHFHSETVCL